MQSPASSPPLVNVAAIAGLAFIAACTSHEFLGHGGACIAQGGRILLLTSVYFHCSNGGVATDLAGPFANLLLGLVAWTLLLNRTWSANLRLFLALIFAFNIFWLAGCMLYSAVAGKSDFVSTLHAFAVNPPWLSRTLLATLGLLVYVYGMTVTSKYVTHGPSLALSYAVAGIVSCMAALFYVGPVVPALREAALESFGSAVGLILLAHRRLRDSPRNPFSFEPAGGFGWSGASILATIVFIYALGRGLVVAGNG